VSPGRIRTALAYRDIPASRAASAVAMVGVAVLATAVAGRPLWHGPAAVFAALLVSTLLIRHCVRRFGGVNGDVLGAAIEVTTTVAAVLLAVKA